MTRGELVSLLTKAAESYMLDPSPIERNRHMHQGVDEPAWHVRRAVVVSFLNHVARGQCMDLGLYDRDLGMPPPPWVVP